MNLYTSAPVYCFFLAKRSEAKRSVLAQYLEKIPPCYIAASVSIQRESCAGRIISL